MILKHRPPRTLSGSQRLGLALVAAVLLLVYPTWADRAPHQDAEIRAQEQELAQAEARVRTDVVDLERQAQMLEQELRRRQARMREQFELEAHRNRLEQDRMRQMKEIGGPLGEMLIEAEASRVRGDLDRAAELAELAEVRLQRELEDRRQVRADRVLALRDELEVLTIKLRQLEAVGHHDEAADIELGIERLRRHVEDITERAD